MKFIKISLVLSAAALFAIACSQTATTPNTANTTANVNKPASTPTATPQTAAPTDEVAMGKDLYIANCSQCHTDTGKGGKVTVDGKTLNPDDITTAKMAAKPDEKFIGYINDGFPDDGMPAFKDKLTPDQVKAVIKHVRSLQKPLAQ